MKSIEINKLIAMFIIACGEAIGIGFSYIPKLPSCFREHLDFNNCCGCYADLICVRVNSDLEIECWFQDKDGDTFSYSLDEIRTMKPYLWISLITHVFDMIENVKEC